MSKGVLEVEGRPSQGLRTPIARQGASVHVPGGMNKSFDLTESNTRRLEQERSGLNL
jgi:hypothetical protein